MRFPVIFFLITLCLTIGEAWARSSNEEDSAEKASSENEIDFSSYGRSSNGASSSEDGSSSKDGSSSENENSSEDDESSSKDDKSSSRDDESSSEAEESTYNSPNKLSRLRNRSLSTPEECARTCEKNEKPKTCYYHFTVENYATLTKACELCRSNSTTRLTSDCQCITADGYELSGIKVVNRMYPGPSIMVCRDDYVVVDVDNHVHGSAITIHWHGLLQKGYQYYDGVPYVTQCPIEEGTTFRYQWEAKNSGTHFWHSHSGFQKSDGLAGAIIVREPKIKEPNSQLWDYDDIDNVIFINDWFHDSAESHFPGNRVRNTQQLPDNYLINGMGQWTDPASGNTTDSPLATLTVKQGHRYRFRMINSCSLNCPIQMTIQGHNLTIIATDGEPVKPVTVDSIVSFSAERYDFVLNAVQTSASYWIQVRGLGECESRGIQQLAILRYESSTFSEPNLERPAYETGLDAGIVLNKLNFFCDGSPESKNAVCVSQLRSAKPVPSRILRREPDVKLFVPFGFHIYEDNDLFKPGTYKKFMVPTGTDAAVAYMGKNVTTVLPPATLISQREEISDEQFCTFEDIPSRCNGNYPCECSLVEEIPLNSLVEIVLVDETHVPNLSHPFHLHGGPFYVVGERLGSYHNITNMNVARAKELDKNGMMTRWLESPPAKDTYAVPNNGYTIIRFLADNPGYWFFHCHFSYHLSVGMSAIFHVGEPSDLPPIPEGFPVCRNFIPPISN